MADERDRLRRQLGLAPLPTASTASVVDERTQRAAMAAASATPTPIAVEPKRYYNYYTGEYVDDPSKIKPRTGMGGPESGGGTIQVTEPVVDTTGYKVVNGVLQFNGQPFTGTYNGQTYENGIVKSAADTTGYKVVNGVLLFNGQPFSGTYSGQTYENGKVKLVTDGNNNNATGYQEVGGVLQFNGKPFTGTFAGTVY